MGRGVAAYSHCLRLLSALTPLCFDDLALLNTQSNNSSCGEERGAKHRTEEKRGDRKQLGAGPIDEQSQSCDLFTAVCYVERREKKSLQIRPQAADIMGPSQSSVSGLLDCQAGFRRCSKALSDQTPEMPATRHMITHCKRSSRGKKRNNYAGY